MKQTHRFNVNGMHCNSCVVLTESELGDLPHVDKATADLKSCCVDVVGEFGDKKPEEIAIELSRVMEKHGYSITVEKSEKNKKGRWGEFLSAVPIAISFLGLFLLLQKAGVVNLVNADSIGYGTALLIGLVASLSTCMAVVGGLVLSLSANYAKGSAGVRPHFLFHAGRLITFFVLGGVIGAIGSSFALSGSGMFILTLLVGLVMLILGLNLLDIFSWTRRLQPVMPKFLSGMALRSKRSTSFIAPLLMGAATFFLPCGFTQSMQVYTLGAGSFMNGALTMFVFALGTLPVLLMLSFGSKKLSEGKNSGVFFKAAGIIVIFFAAINIINSLAVAGIIEPLINF